MKSLRSCLSLSTALVIFTITPNSNGLAGGHQEESGATCTECTHRAKSRRKDKRDITMPRQKAVERSHRHHCPFCDADSIWGSLEREATRGLQEMEKTLRNVKTMLQDSGNAAALAEGEAEECARYSLQEFTPAEKDRYGIKISLPNFKQEDLKVTVNTKQIYGKKAYNVEITAQKQENASKKDTTEETNGTKTTIQRFTAQHFQSATYINGKRKEITYENGNLHIFFDLPSDIDPNNYDMKFENGFLTLTFAKKDQTDHTKKILEFNK